MNTSLFDYHLPKELIAHEPITPRDSARVFVVEGEVRHHDFFYNIGKYVKKGDILVRNVTKVFPARLYATKMTGGKVEILLVRPLDGSRWECLVGGRAKDGMEVRFDCRDVPLARLSETPQGGVSMIWIIDFGQNIDNLGTLIETAGQTPVPPYIHTDMAEQELRDRYQTIYAHKSGSVAAPTAGLHFTDELIDQLKRQGIEFLDIILNVGIGTFLPVKTKNVEDHSMHAEYVDISNEVAQKICSAKYEGRRLIAIGTTTTRALEACADTLLLGKGYTGEVNIFITPGYEFRMIDGLVTNFHLPKSTLLMLVSAFAGRENILSCYQEAIALGYTFYSFGDAMLIS